MMGSYEVLIAETGYELHRLGYTETIRFERSLGSRAQSLHVHLDSPEEGEGLWCYQAARGRCMICTLVITNNTCGDMLFNSRVWVLDPKPPDVATELAAFAEKEGFRLMYPGKPGPGWFTFEMIAHHKEVVL